MADITTWVPEGFVEGTHPMITEVLAAALERRGGPHGGPMRVTVRLKRGASAEDALAFLLERPERRARRLLPGLFSIETLPPDIDAVLARKDLFAWLDLGGRVTGAHPQSADAPVVVRIALAGENEAIVMATVLKLGGRILGRGAQEVLATMTAGAAPDLLRLAMVEAIDVSEPA